MTQETELCGFQPTGRSEDVPKPPKFNTDKLSVEKLQDHLLPYSKEMVKKIRDEKIQLVTADEFVKLHKESLTAIRENDKLQEKLNTAKKALTEAIGDIEQLNGSDDTIKYYKQALAAIGGDDEKV